MHLTCKLLPLIASYLVLLSHLHHALDVRVASLSANTGNKAQKLTLRTNVRVASTSILPSADKPHLTPRTNVRVASHQLSTDSIWHKTYAPHERAGCFSKFAQLCVMPVRIKCTGFVPYRELSYCPKEELRPLTRFKDAKSPYSYANAPALLCELAVRTRHCFEWLNYSIMYCSCQYKNI